MLLIPRCSTWCIFTHASCSILMVDDVCDDLFAEKTHTTFTWFRLLLPHPIWICFFIIHIYPIHTNAMSHQSNPKIKLESLPSVMFTRVFLPIISKSRICNITYNNLNTVNYPLNCIEPYSQVPPIHSNCHRIIVYISI